MKRNLLSLTLFTIIFLTQITTKAQFVLKEADQQYELFNYNKAIDLYEQAYKKKPTLHAAERLADAYRMQNGFVQAESWYAIAVKMPESKAENTLNYAKSLQQNSKYSEAKVQYLNYFEKDKTTSSNFRNSLLASCDSALLWMKDPKKIVINNENTLNSSRSDWGSFVYKDAIVFTSDRTTALADKLDKRSFLKFDGSKLPNKKVYGWTGNGYLKLYTKQENDSVQLFPIKTNTNYHVGSASFTADGNTMFFTLTRIPERIKDKTTTINVETFSSVKGADGKWSEPVSFKLNRVNEYSVGDPFISPDGNRLYFISNMPDGLGGNDIYYIDKTDNGEWGLAVNVKELNTAGNERSPFLDQNGDFYFSSDSRIGMGGLDIYQYVKNSSGVNQIKNMGYPINSPQDDFAFNIDGRTGLAYLSSNRNGGLGSDDIYSLDRKTIIAFKLYGKVYDKKTNQPMANAIVTLTKFNGSSLKVETDNTGTFNFNLDKESDYNLNGEKTNYRSDVASISTKSLTTSNTINRDLYLEFVEIGKAIKLENIYYDFDKWNIRADAALELDKLVTIMKDNPTIWIELGSHTDSRGKDVYNQTLSQKRAESAVQYIISRGINKNRITAKGYGEAQLLNKCTNGVACKDEEHQLNRRTEFKIVRQ